MTDIERARRMSDAIKLMTEVLTTPGQAMRPCAWEDLLVAVHEVTSARTTQQVEDLLVKALRFKGRFNLTPTSVRPHRLSPEDMVKSLVIQAFGRWGAVHRIPDIKRIESTSRSPGLASIARLTILRLRARE